jgi:FkbM family methyltransferase
MQRFCRRLWNTSLASLTKGLRRRYQDWRARPDWHLIKSGPNAGVTLFLPRAHEGGWKEMADGTYDLFFYNEIRKVADLKGAICWDIGAHFGYHSVGFAALGAEVTAFEPNEHNAKILRMNLERNPDLGRRIRHMPLALADRDGEMSFIQTSDLKGGSSGSHLEEAMQIFESGGNPDKVKVPVARIDTLIDERGEKKPDILKIDVEGGEALVLRGAQKLLTNHKPVLLIEVHHIRLMFEVQELLLRYGYDIKLLDEDHGTASRCFIMAYSSAGKPMAKTASISG